MSTWSRKPGSRQNRALFGTGTTVGKIRIMEESPENTELAQILAKSEWAGGKMTGIEEAEVEKKDANVNFVEILEKEEKDKEKKKKFRENQEYHEKGSYTFVRQDGYDYEEDNFNEYFQPNNYELPPKGSYAAYVESVRGPSAGLRIGGRRQISEEDRQLQGQLRMQARGRDMQRRYANQNQNQNYQNANRGFQNGRMGPNDIPTEDDLEDAALASQKQELVALNPKLIITQGTKSSSKKVIKKGNIIVGRTFRLDLGIDFDNDLEEEEEEEELELEPKSKNKKSLSQDTRENLQNDINEEVDKNEPPALTPEEEEELMEFRAAARAQLNSKKQRLAKLLKEADDDYDYFSGDEGGEEEEGKKEEEEEDMFDNTNSIAYSTRYGFVRGTRNVYGQVNNGQKESGEEAEMPYAKSPEPVSYSRKVSLVPADFDPSRPMPIRRSRDRGPPSEEEIKRRLLKESGVEEATSKGGIKIQRVGEPDAETGEMRFPLAHPRRTDNDEFQRGPPPGFVPVAPPGFAGGPPPGFVPVNPPPGKGMRYQPPPPGYMGGPPPPGYMGGPPPPGYMGGPPMRGPPMGGPHIMGRRVQPSAPGELRRGRRQQPPPPPGMY